MNIKTLVDRFLTWPLPQTVAADRCATDNKYQFSRSGTNLLTAKEAEAMLVYVLGLEDEFSLDVKSNTAPPPASTNRLTDEQIAALRIAADALIERYAEPIRAILRNAERVDGLTVKDLRTLMMRHAKSYSEWDSGSLERVDFGQYGFDEFARAIIAATEAK